MLLWLLVTQSVPKCSKQFFKVTFIISCSNFNYPLYVLDSFSQKALHICLALFGTLIHGYYIKTPNINFVFWLQSMPYDVKTGPH